LKDNIGGFLFENSGFTHYIHGDFPTDQNDILLGGDWNHGMSSSQRGWIHLSGPLTTRG